MESSKLVSENLNQPECHLSDLSETFTEEQFVCQNLTLSCVQKNTFVNCFFPNLTKLTMTKCQERSFVGCHFPQLKEIQVPSDNFSTGSFWECHFLSDFHPVDSSQFVDCKYDYSEESEQIHIYDSIVMSPDYLNPDKKSDTEETEEEEEKEKDWVKEKTQPEQDEEKAFSERNTEYDQDGKPIHSSKQNAMVTVVGMVGMFGLIGALNYFKK